MKTILLCCGMGMSSGFLAVSIRKAVKRQNLNYKVIACSVAEIDQYLPVIDVLLVATPFANRINELKRKAADYNVKVQLIPKADYSELNGTNVLRLVQNMIA
ncbi:PTS system cellobiose-specific IIB component [Lactobacillus colini]|uniref:PTS system cellobiose-specific IIB component n=1 Tax=Lactobacillus colini TaxID=1819254 RepID=A0ABS4MGY4_9LACO|nr:PTS sugar transporter subunit IIB [Lactobacillus colini]MBP2058962.1 PTS system cellobiose-specific IIB component [Lactobacillus colini]